MCNPDTKLNDKPCPKCGCYLIANFNCFCGEVHSDYCVNCGRWTELQPNQYINFTPILDERCSIGRVYHEHSEKEKSNRLRAYFEYMKKSRELQ